MNPVRNALALVVILLCSRTAAAGPTIQAAVDRLNVFVDCQFCFQDYIRTEITFVDYVREPADAHLHIIITRQSTGSGGQERAIQFIGLGPFRGIDQVLRHAAARADTEDDVRRGLVTTLKVGLLRYLIETSAAERLDVSVSVAGGAGAAPRAPDQWNSWVLSVRSSAGVEAEESTREVDLRGAIGADRVTADWKISLGSSIDYSADRFDLEEEEGTLLSVRRERLLRGLVVRSLGGHWSLGARGSVRSSTFRNTSAAVTLAPAVEYNLFPYTDYTHRQLRFQYSIGTTRIRYLEETIFGRTEETLAEQEVSVTLDQRQPWGTLRTRGEISHYLHDASKHRLEVFGDLSFRVARGLSLTLSGSGSRVRDQLSLPRRGATAEEVLLRQRQLRSNYEYRFAAGFTYSFGSIYNSIVNPRFGQ